MSNEHEHGHHGDGGPRPHAGETQQLAEPGRRGAQDANHSESRGATPPHNHHLHDPSLYINRELSWLDFNERVLQLAEDEPTPLMERVKFCAIYTTNLDEYYMVRVAGLHDQIDAGVENPSQDGLTPSDTIDGIRERVLELGERLSGCFERACAPRSSSKR